MRFGWFRISAILVAVLIAISFLGGSAFWQMIGLGNSLTITGEAEIVRETPAGMGESWTSYGGDPGGNRFVAADQITADNVADLTIAWTHNSGVLEGKTDDQLRRSALQTTPILVEGSLIYCTQFNQIIALDPGSGEERWRYDPEVPLDGRPGNQFTCRGVSYWAGETGDETGDSGEGEPCAARLFMGTVDARLIAVDARTGEPCADFGDNGAVQIEPSISLAWPGEFQITSAPAIIGSVVVTGSSISDNLRADAPHGTVHAFDVITGELRWTFNPVPRDPEDPARASWAGDSAERTGHANVWSTMAVDEARGLVFLPTSSASPDYFGGARAGDNRYANSVVALDGETGEVAWHFQTVHHDVWDYDLPAQPGLYQVWRDGMAHDVVAQVTKTGLLFVLDRDTGEPFLPIEERAVPQGGVDGEQLSPTQPFPVNTPPLIPNHIDPDDAFGITLWDRWACAARIRGLRGDGLYTPPTEQGSLAYPFTGGGANWGSSAFDPQRNLLIVNLNNMLQATIMMPNDPDSEDYVEIEDGAEYAPMQGVPYGMARPMLISPLGLPCNAPPWGVLAGIDLASGEIVWRSTLGTTEDLAGGAALPFGTPNLGGPIVTSGGLIFIGAAMDDYLRAFDTASGRELWKGRLPAGGQATPMSYMWEGRQYVVIAAGGHGRAGTRRGDAIIAFALPE